jgi:hypothetical protein
VKLPHEGGLGERGNVVPQLPDRDVSDSAVETDLVVDMRVRCSVKPFLVNGSGACR